MQSCSAQLSPSDRWRPPFVYWWCLWGIGLGIPIASVGIDIFMPHPASVIGRDFSNLWVAGKLAIAGESWRIFDLGAFRLALFNHLGIASLQNYSYPPHALFIAVPFALLPYGVALALWTALGVGFFVWCARPWLAGDFPLQLSVLTPAAGINIWNGHYGFIVGGLWLLCFRDLPDRPGRAGLSAGLLTFKPHMGLLIAVATLTRRKAVIAAIVTTLVLVISSAAIFGVSTWTQFLSSTLGAQTAILTRPTGEFYFRMMPSAYVAFGHGIAGAVAHILFATAALILLARSKRIDPFTFATATFLIVPYVFNYDMTVVCLGCAMLLWCKWPELTLAERAILSLAFLSPEITYFADWMVPPVLLATLYIQTASSAARLSERTHNRGDGGTIAARTA